jgi:hypothetical protein
VVEEGALIAHEVVSRFEINVDGILPYAKVCNRV